MQSSVAEGGIPQKAVDGSTSTFFDLSTCSLTEVEKSPWWYVNLLEPYMVQLVRIDFGQSCCGKCCQGWDGLAKLLAFPDPPPHANFPVVKPFSPHTLTNSFLQQKAGRQPSWFEWGTTGQTWG